MRIAIVDDIASEREKLENKLRLQLARLSPDAEIFEYESGEAFLDAAGSEPFSMVFLDIYMDGINGVETARRLRAFDRDCILVFTTTSTDFALEAFQVRALQYLVKPYTDRELEEIFREVADRLPDSEPYLDLHSTDGPVKLRLSEIQYAEHFQHQIYIHSTKGRTTVVRQTFREFTKSLGDSRFFLCSRGVIVNLEYAEEFDGRDFVLANGVRIPVSRGLAKDARLAFSDFLFKKCRRK